MDQRIADSEMEEEEMGVSANGQGVSFWSNKDALEVGNGDVEKLCKH